MNVHKLDKYCKSLETTEIKLPFKFPGFCKTFTAFGYYLQLSSSGFKIPRVKAGGYSKAFFISGYSSLAKDWVGRVGDSFQFSGRTYRVLASEPAADPLPMSFVVTKWREEEIVNV